MTVLATADATTGTRPAPARSGSSGRTRGTRLRAVPDASEATHQSADHDAEPAAVHIADRAAHQPPTRRAKPPARDIEPVSPSVAAPARDIEPVSRSVRTVAHRAEPGGRDSNEVQPLSAGAAADSGPVTLTIRIDGAGRDRLLALLRDLVAEAGPGAAVLVAAEDGGIHGRATPSRLGGASRASAPSTNGQTPDGFPGPGAGRPGEIRLDPGPRTVARDGWPLHLSRLEYDLLLFLARHPRQVFSRSQLLAQVWGHTHTTNRTVDVHVSRLRTKLGDQDMVTTVYGLGYRLADDALITVAD
jgi:Transcriptional regulatory protein, C terminal